MAQNNEGNARKRLSDYARPVLQRPITRIHSPLNRGANFIIDFGVMSMLPIFHGEPSKDTYRHVHKLSRVCEINHLQNFSADTMTMKLFQATLRDRAKDCFIKLGKEFTSWTENEEEFLRKYYYVGKTTSIRKVTDQMDVVINCTPIHVKIKSKLTNLMKITRIEGYNGKYGSNPQGIRKIFDDLFKFELNRTMNWW